MGKRVVTFEPGESETDDVVRRWIRRNGINENDVMGYSIKRHSGELSTIELTMFFDDTPEQPASTDEE